MTPTADLRKPIDPANRSRLIEWMLSMQYNDHDNTPDELEEDSLEMYQQVVPKGYCVVRRDDLAAALNSNTTLYMDQIHRLRAAVQEGAGDGE